MCKFLLKYLLSILQPQPIREPRTEFSGPKSPFEGLQYLLPLYPKFAGADSFMCLDHKTAQWFRITARDRGPHTQTAELRQLEVRSELWHVPYPSWALRNPSRTLSRDALWSVLESKTVELG